MANKAKLALALLASSALIAPSLAQAAPLQEFTQVDGNGVDLTSGQFFFSLVEGSIGDDEGGVSMVRSWAGINGWQDNWSGVAYQTTEGGQAVYYVEFGPISDSFTFDGTNWISRNGDGAALTVGATSLIYTASDGTSYSYNGAFDDGRPFAGPRCPSGGCYIPVGIAKPNGRGFTLNWDFDAYFQNPLVYYRFAGVDSNANYSFSITYLTGNPGQGSAPVPNWFKRTQVQFTNTLSPPSPLPTVTYAYPSSTITDVTVPGGRTWRLTAATAGNLSGIRRPGSASDNVTIAYGVAAPVVSSVTKDGVATTYSRTVVGTTITETRTDALSNQVVVTSDSTVNRPSSVKDPLNRTTSYQYDSNKRVTRATQPEGNYTQLTYDGRGNVTQTKAVSKTPGTPADIIASASFDTTCSNVLTCNQPNTTTDPKGNVTDYTYAATHGGVLTITDPAPTNGAVRPQTRYAYTLTSGAYLPTSISECQTLSSCTGAADEAKTTIGYNSNGLPNTVSAGNGTGSLTATTTATYDSRGNLLTVDGPLTGTADTTAYKYDSADELIGAISPDPDGAGSLKNRAIRLIYRSDGQVSKQELGNTIGQSDSDFAAMTVSQTVDITFDTNSRLVTSKLSASGTDFALTQTSYDALGRVDCTAVRMNTAIYGSLPASACTLGTQGSFGPDRISQTVYDAASEITQQKVSVGTSDAATERLLTYSNNSMLATLKDAEANLTTYEYDGFDRLAKTRYPNSTKGSGTSSTTDYEQPDYDANSNINSRRLRDGNSIAFSFDNLNRVTLKDLPGSEPDVSYGYDNLSRLTSASQTGNSLSFTYDALNRKLTEVGPQGTATSAYDLANRRTQLTYPGSGLYVNYDYLVTGEVTKVRENGATSGVGVLATYGYDNLGNRTSVTFGNGASQVFTYDAVSRLASLTNDLSGTPNDLSATFGYNPASGITSTVRTGDAYAWTGHGNGSTAYTQNGLNQQITIGGSTANWDSKGNLISEPQSAKTYGYSSENLLTSVPSASVSLSYDPARRLYQVTSGTTTRFAYDGMSAIAEYDGTNALQRRFVFGPGIDEPIVQYEGTGTTNRRFMGVDERGSVISLTDSSGTLLNINRYDEYGKPQSTNSGRFQYTGQKWIGEANLYDYKARDYLPHLGIFAQTDPIAYADSPNLYAYVGNDPLNVGDPLGLQEEDIVVTHLSFCAEFPQACGPLAGGGAGVGGAARTHGSQVAGDSSLPPSVAPAEKPIFITGTRRRQQSIGIAGNRVGQLAGFPWIDLIHLPFPVDQLGDCVVACFEAGTLVATPTGLKPIEEIAVGDLVLSEDERTGTVAAKKVTRLIRPEPKPVYELFLLDSAGELETFHVTADHRWKVDGKGWIETAGLKIGDRIETDSKADVSVTEVTVTNIVERTYNLEVADWHTFMVGKDHVLVHNGECDPNRLRHIFRPDHPRAMALATKLGSQEAAFQAMQSKAQQIAKLKGLTGLQTLNVVVAGLPITIQGNVINGVFRISTAW